MLNYVKIMKRGKGLHMKKAVLAASLMLLCGCQTTKKETEKPLYFVFATPLSTHTLWLQAKSGMQDACDLHHIQCDWQGPIKISTEQMEDVIQTAILKKADGIITQGVIKKTYIMESMEQNVPIVLVDSPVKDAKPLATICKDFEQQAQMLLTDIEKRIGKNEHLRIGIQVSEQDFDLAKQQIESVRTVFKKHPGGFEIVAISESKSDQSRSRNEWISVLQKEKNLNITLNFAGESAIGCVMAREYLNMQDDLLIYGVDDMDDTVKMIKEGKIAGSIVTSFYRYGYDSVEMLYEYVRNGKEPVKELQPAQILLLNKGNLKTYEKELKE